tara:strand:+ start:520 stop:894 length:375 start_codon:yes stop_codon:yes gene_type:complete
MSNYTSTILLNDTILLGNLTNWTNLINSTNVTESGFDLFFNNIYYEIDAMKNSQMIMGTMFLGMVLGMIIMVLCCVKHKSDGYYRVPPQKTVEEIELFQRENNERDRRSQDARFEIGLGDTDDD